MKDKFKATFIVLFIMIIIAGFLFINYKDPAVKNGGAIYFGLSIGAMSLIYFGKKILKK